MRVADNASMFSMLLLLILLVDHAAASPAVEVPRSTTAWTCDNNAVHLIVAPNQNASGKNGAMQTLVDLIKKKYPGTTVTSISYDNSDSQAINAQPAFASAITTFASACPRTRMVLLGYSLGGIVTMNTLCGGSGKATNAALSPRYTHNIIATIVYGDETFVAKQSYDQGTCTMDAPLYARNNPSCEPFAFTIQSWCDAKDPECCTGGSDMAAHYRYPAKYDDAALKYIVGKLDAWKHY